MWPKAIRCPSSLVVTLDKFIDSSVLLNKCAKGTRACFTQINSKADDKDRIISVIPLMSSSTQNLTFQAGTSRR